MEGIAVNEGKCHEMGRHGSPRAHTSSEWIVQPLGVFSNPLGRPTDPFSGKFTFVGQVRLKLWEIHSCGNESEEYMYLVCFGNGQIELCEMWGIGLARFLSGVLYIIPDAPRRQLPIDRLGGQILTYIQIHTDHISLKSSIFEGKKSPCGHAGATASL